MTWKQLDEALEALAASLAPAPETPAGVAGRLAEIVLHADTVIDIARTLTVERGDGDAAEVLAWAEALGASVRAHERDVASADALRAAARGRGRARAPLRLDPDPGRSAGPLRGGSRRSWRASATEARRPLPGRRPRALGRRRPVARATSQRRSPSGAGSMLQAMDFGFLFDAGRQLLSIGYRVADGELDPSCYDLLASEARLASFVAIAKGDVPVRHWFRLGRALTPVDHGSALISWSGSMFEYLMPSLVMRAPAGSLLEQTSRFVVRRQMKYGAKLGVPWGVSESAYNARDIELTYQYSNFGVPGLGLKRGLSEDAVVAPYATALAAMVDPQAAARELLPSGRSRWPGPVRLVRGPRLHTVASTRRRAGRDRPRLHGAPPGDDPGLDR